MFGVGPATRIYLAAGATDMRKGFEGLYGLVRDQLQLEPLSGHMFLFSNAQRNRLKLGSGTAAACGFAPTNSLHTTPLSVVAQHVENLPAHLLLDPPTDPIDCNV